KFDLEFSLNEQQDRIVGSLGYATALFERSTIERHLAQFVTLLQGMVADDHARVAQLPLLPADERTQLQRFTVTETAPLAPATCIHHLFEAQVRRTPDAIALREGQRLLRYAELEARANQLAQRLRRSGVGLESRVALYLPRGIDQVVAVLATLKAGAAYVPLDPELPSERLAFLLEDSRPRAVLTCTDLQDRLPASRAMLRVSVLTLDDSTEKHTDDPGAPDVPGLCPDNLAYVIYTSGSTGQPKGTLLTHAGAAHYLQWAIEHYRPQPSAVVSSSLSFDATLTSLLAPLLCGAQVELLPEYDTLDALRQRLCDPTPLGLVKLTPAHLEVLGQQLTDQQTPLSPAVMVIGGEALPPATLARWQALAPHTRLINEYGPTETVVGCVVHTTTADDAHAPNGRVPIGQPIAHLRLYVLDAHGQHAPIGVAGHLHIAGPQLARGYLGRADLTAERFIPDPFAEQPGARMYRSGDVACWRADGTLEYLGRNDDQVKLRGFRIELGEIAAALRACTGVQDAAVLLREDTPGEPRLVAYVVGEVERIDAESLRSDLVNRLPEVMLPTAYVCLETLPLTANGKLDRKALPAPDGAAYAASAYEAPQGEIEQVIAAIWRELLGLESIGRHDNFFALGGHSLLAVRVASRLRKELGVEIGVAELFVHATLQQLAACVASSSAAILPPILPLQPDAPRVLSFAQQRLWFLSQFEGVSQAYHISGGLRLRGVLDAQALQRALDRIVARHASLRTTFALVDGQALQHIADEESGFHLIAHNLCGVADGEVALQQLLVEEAQAPFALEQGPLIRGRLIRLANDESVLFVTMHHIVSDGWSMGILINELSVLYRAFACGEADPLPPLPIQYADYASWQRQWLKGNVLEQQATYWRETLSGAPVLLELPTDRPRPARQDHAGAMLQVIVEPQQAQALKALSQRHGLTLYMTLLASWALLLSRLSGQDDVVIGSPVANRGRSETEGLIGFFVNTLALRVELSGSPTLAQLLALVKNRTLQAQAHQDIPFEQVVELLQPPRSLAHAPLFQVMFAWQNTPQGELDLGELDASGLGVAQTSAQFDLSLSLTESEEGIVGSLAYATALFERSTLERWMGHWRHLLDAMVAEGAEHQAVDRLPLLDDAERYQLLTQWNATAADYPRDACVHELFEAQVAHDPSAIAVVQGEVALTYGELNARANRLAHYLRELGVRPDDRVAICVQRSVEMVIAVVAVLKAGGAYVPLDPAYPPERLAYMQSDCGAVVMLTDTVSRHLVEHPAASTVVVDLQADGQRWAHLPDSNPDRTAVGLTSGHLAYVIYTSGSTGMPKGAMNEHRGVVNRLVWMQEAYTLDRSEVVLQKTPMSFDVSVWELFWSLLSGARMQLTESEGHKDPVYLKALIRDTQVTTLHFVPSMLRAFVEHGDDDPCTGVRRVICSGEALPAALAERAQAVFPSAEIFNLYGPTEAAVDVTAWRYCAESENTGILPIGRPIANTQIYILDVQGAPVPIGVVDELYIGGDGVGRGYLNHDDLTAARFLMDPFSADPTARMYRTGDLGRWRADGTLEFVGRNDHQVKIRGFRIELGEIEARLSAHADVRECVVIALDDLARTDKRLVAYWVGAEDVTPESIGPEVLRSWLSGALPDYMLPAAYVQLDRLPLTPNGKLDRNALPAPDGTAYAIHAYEAPQGEVEQAIAAIWCDLLGLDTIGRHDNFFALGGHSLLAISLIERLRRQGWQLQVRALFSAPTLADLANTLTAVSTLSIPPNRIASDCTRITPELLPLVELSQTEIDAAVATVDGGTANVQDIYPLAPLQEGLLFHHLASPEGDAYLNISVLTFDSRTHLDAFVAALQAVIARHDILRTGFVWQGLRTPVQVVWRHAPLPLQTHVIEDPNVLDALRERMDPSRFRLDVSRAPLIHAHLVEDPAHARWLLGLHSHHLMMDHTTLELLVEEVQAHLHGQQAQLPAPLPFRNFVAHARLGVSEAEHRAFFTQHLGDLETPTAPFDLWDVRGTGADIEQTLQPLPDVLSSAVRQHARQLGVSPSSLFHLACALVLAQASGQDDVVFGTTLFGRMQGGSGADRVLGMFLNTLPIRLRRDGRSVAEAIRQTQQQLAQLLHHEHAPLALAQRCSSIAPPTPLFTALLNYRYVGGSAVQTPSEPTQQPHDWHGLEMLAGLDRNNYPLTISIDDITATGGFAVEVKVNRHIGTERVIALMQQSMQVLIQALEQAPDTALYALSLLPTDERAQLQRFTVTETAPLAPATCIHRLFEAQVQRTPDAIAVREGTHTLRYAELDARANRLAQRLRRAGVGLESRVALYLPRGIDQVVAVLATLKAGAAYVPLDSELPSERLAFLLEDSRPRAVLTCTDLQDRLPASRAMLRVSVLTLDDNTDTQHDDPGAPDVPGLCPDNLAYVIYTSGSTGQPKGTLLTHAGATHYLQYAIDTYRPQPSAVVSSSLSFDATLTSLLAPLLCGAQVELLPEHDTLDALRQRLCDPTPLGLVKLTPAHLEVLGQQLTDQQTPLSPAVMVIGGEALPPATLARWQALAPHTRLINEYGPTETVVGCAVHTTAADDAHASNGRVPIGKPIAHLRLYVLDAHGQPAPMGVAGELHIAGPQLARGYLGRADLTAERFIPDPFAEQPGARMYRSGDVACWRADGTLEYLGRNDDQVKLRGFRIELGEIAAALHACAGVQDATVLLREDVPGEPRLVAYVVGDADAYSTENLRSELANRLPEVMLPTAYVHLEALPLTANGKLDRKALPAPDGAAYAARAYEAPQGAIEQAIAAIWSDILGLETIGRHDNFFALGGHSLLAVSLTKHMRQQGLQADLRTLFANPTLAALAASSGAISVSVPPNLIKPDTEIITPELLPLVTLTQEQIDSIVAMTPGGTPNIQDIYPLAPLQEGIFFHHLLQREGDTYLLSNLIAFDSRSLLDSFVDALQCVIDRHDILRTAIAWEGLAAPVQVVWRHASLVIEDICLAQTDGNAAAQLQSRFDPQHWRLDMRKAPLICGFAAQDVVSGRWLLQLLSHHLVLDQTTLQIVLEEVRCHLCGKAASLPAALPFRNFVAQALLGVSREEHEAYFRTMLGNVDEPCAPFGVINVQGDGSDLEEARLELPDWLSAALRNHARALGVSAASLFHLAWAQVVARATGRERVVLGTILFGRMQGVAGGDQAVGLLLNTLPLRIEIDGTSVLESVHVVQQRLAALLRHEHAPLSLAQRCSDVPAPAPLFTSLLNYRHSVQIKDAADFLTLEGIEILQHNRRTSYPLMASIDDVGPGFVLTVQSQRTLFPERICAFLLKALEVLVDALIHAPQMAVRDLDVLPEAERHQLLTQWNATAVDYPRDACVHELFEMQVARAPSAIAVVQGER
ncbi:non-ribosomal peptide synthetase, partial [Xanthomonas sp. GPE 39]|uniref:non-ribosomal peptide synthetase n=1 Tax=Xanthomonas sp. GPE 39 TaxID=1583099 RepID=UPI000698F452